jgi:hypothetical protein
MSVKKLVLPNYAGKKLQVCKMSKLQIFVTFGRIVTWSEDLMLQSVGGDTGPANSDGSKYKEMILLKLCWVARFLGTAN